MGLVWRDYSACVRCRLDGQKCQMVNTPSSPTKSLIGVYSSEQIALGYSWQDPHNNFMLVSQFH